MVYSKRINPEVIFEQTGRTNKVPQQVVRNVELYFLNFADTIVSASNLDGQQAFNKFKKQWGMIFQCGIAKNRLPGFLNAMTNAFTLHADDPFVIQCIHHLKQNGPLAYSVQRLQQHHNFPDDIKGGQQSMSYVTWALRQGLPITSDIDKIVSRLASLCSNHIDQLECAKAQSLLASIAQLVQSGVDADRHIRSCIEKTALRIAEPEQPQQLASRHLAKLFESIDILRHHPSLQKDTDVINALSILAAACVPEIELLVGNGIIHEPASLKRYLNIFLDMSPQAFLAEARNNKQSPLTLAVDQISTGAERSAFTVKLQTAFQTLG